MNRVLQFFSLLFFVTVFIPQLLKAQMTITPLQTANQLVDRLVGPGVVYSNPTLTCPSYASGKFDFATTTTVTMDSGIVLTTGDATDVNFPASFSASTNNSFYTSDVDLAAAATGSLNDLCKLEFDFVPIGDTIRFNYRFGSDEYPSYTCSNYNDIFSFFISGPGYAVPKNVALIPGTNCPVSINTVNGSTANPCGNVGSPCAPPNNALFINSSGSASVIYSGLTQKLMAVAAVQPCSTYHMKFAIADVFDEILDSGVFLEANSFMSEAATIATITSSNSLPTTLPFAIEGCNNSVITIERPNPKPIAQNIALVIGGTATSGLDYTPLPAVVTIPPFATTVQIPIIALSDALIEGTETVKVYVYGTICGGTITDSAIVEIREYPSYTVSDDDTICLGLNATLMANSSPFNADMTFTWSPTGATIPASGSVVTASPLTTTSYTVTANFPGCPLRDSTITISVENLPTLSLAADSLTCFNASNGQITATGTAGSSPFTFTLNQTSQTQVGSPSLFTTLNAGNYDVIITSAGGCTATSSIIVPEPQELLFSNVSVVDIPCGGVNSGEIQVQTIGGSMPITFTLLPNNISNSTGLFTGLGLGSYTINAEDAHGCAAAANATIAQPVGPVITNVSITDIDCYGNNNGAIDVTASSSSTITYVLSPGNISNTLGQFNGLNSGIYTVTLSDATNCSVTTAVTIATPSLLTWNGQTTTMVSCNGLSDGEIQINAIGGTGLINYTLQPLGLNNTSGLFSGLAAASYTITATDENNCFITSIINITEPNLLQILSATNTTPTCVPGNDATIFVSGSGGTLPYNYSMGGPSQLNGNFLNLGAGNYTVTISDSHFCSVTTVISIVNPNAPNWVSVNSSDVTCFNGTNGQVSVSANGGIGIITYTILPSGNNNTSGSFSNLVAGNYTVQSVDAIGCSVTTSIVVNQPSDITWMNSSVTDVDCNNANNGAISVSASGGTGILSYLLNPGNISNVSGVFNGLSPNSYTITVSDVNACSQSTILNIIQPNPLTWNSTTTSMVACHGDDDGMLQVNVIGGTGSISYSIQPGSLSNSTGLFSSLNANSYTVTATDANNCFITSVLTITEPALLQFTSATNTTPTCVPGNDATINVTVTGGSLPYSYSIGGTPQSTGSFSNLGAGTYTITVTDDHSCSVTSLITIIAPNTPLFTSSNSFDISCFNGTNGIISTTASGGVGALSYTLLPNGISNTIGSFTNLIAGNYAVQASDAIGCSVSSVFQLTQPSDITWTSSAVTNVSCNNANNGTIVISATGGTGAISYTLNPGSINSASGNFSSLGVGIYTMTATDINSCTLTTTLNVIQPNSLSWNVPTTTMVTCNGLSDGGLQVNANGGTGIITYLLQPGNLSNTTGNFSSLNATAFTITATDANNCFITTIVTITEPAIVAFTSVSNTTPSCLPGNDATISLAASGGTLPYNYSIGGTPQSSGTFSGLNAGTFTMTISDGNSCSVTSTVNIVAPISPIITSSSFLDVTCFNGNNGSLTVTASGGNGLITYTMMPGAITNTSGGFVNLIAGNYTIIATDAIGCSVSTVININQPTDITWTNSAITNVSCNNANNGVITISAAGGTGTISYTLNPGNVVNTTGSFSSLGVGVYTMTATDINSCTLTTTLNVIQPNSLSWNTPNANMVTCNGLSDGSIQISANGGTGVLTYLLQPGNLSNTSGNFISLAANSYTVTVTDANNCFITTVINITEPATLQITSASNTTPTCVPGSDASITILANGGTTPYSYSIGGGSQSTNVFGGLSSGNFTITVTDDHTCSATSIISIAPPLSPLIDQTFATEATCNPGCDAQVSVIASGGLVNTYTYSSNSITYQLSSVLSGLCASSYTISVKDGNGCTASSVLAIVTAPSPLINSQSATDVLCNGGSNGSLVVTASGGNGVIGYTLQSTGATSATGNFGALAAGVYTVLATDAFGCTTTTSLSISEPPILQIDSLSLINVTCAGANNGSLFVSTVGGFGAVNLSISPTATFSSPGSFINLTGNTTYTVTATDANACTITTSALIAQPASVAITLTTHNDISCYGLQDGSIQVSAAGGTGALTYLLQPGALSNTTGSFAGLTAGIYTITVTDIQLCSVSTQVNIVNAIPIVLNSIQSTPVSCNNGNNGSLTISCGGGLGVLNYQLQPLGTNNSTGLFTNLNAGSYTVVVTDANACTYSTVAVIANPSTIVFSSVVPTNINCYGDSTGAINVQATGGNGAIGYQLNPGLINSGTGVFANLLANNYIITAIDANNCTATTSVGLTQPVQMFVQLISQQNPNCFGEQTGSIQFLGNGGTAPLSYNLQPTNLSNNTGLFTNLSAGVYSLTLVDGNQCQLTYPVVSLTHPNLLQLSLVQKQDIACFGQSSGSIQVAANGGSNGFLYSIVPSLGIQMVPGDFQNLKAGTYFITVTDAHACTTSLSVTLNQGPEIHFSEVSIVEPLCYGDANGVISWMASGGTGNLIYQLDNNSTQVTGLFTNLTGGWHTLSVIDGINCRKDTLVLLTEPIRIHATASSSAVTCKDASDGKLNIQGIGGRGELTYYLRPGLHINKHGFFSHLHEGIYTLTVKDSAGCNFDTVMVVDPPQFPMTSNIVKQDLGCYGVGTEGWARADVTGGVQPLTYFWSTSPTQVDQTATGLYFGYYFVDITDANGCTIHDTVYIEPGPCCTEIFIPSAFSPNGDGQNDIFKVTTSTGIELRKFEIYDRWGNKIWETFDPRRGWDGSYRGSTEDMNTFYYVFWYKCLEDGQTYMKKGDVIIVR